MSELEVTAYIALLFFFIGFAAGSMLWLIRLLARIAAALEKLEEKLPIDGYGRLAVSAEVQEG